MTKQDKPAGGSFALPLSGGGVSPGNRDRVGPATDLGRGGAAQSLPPGPGASLARRGLMVGQLPDPGFFYVTAVQDKRVAWLVGPLATHAEAIELVDAARQKACEIDVWMDFAAFGTAERKAAPYPVGKLNEALGVVG